MNQESLGTSVVFNVCAFSVPKVLYIVDIHSTFFLLEITCAHDIVMSLLK